MRFSETQTEGSAPSSGTLELEFTLTNYLAGYYLWFEAKTAANVAAVGGEDSETNREDLWTAAGPYVGGNLTNINVDNIGVDWTVPDGTIANHPGPVYTYTNTAANGEASRLLIMPILSVANGFIANGTHIITIDLTASVMNAWANSGTIRFRGHHHQNQGKTEWADVTINALSSGALSSGSVCFLGQTKVTTDQGKIMFNKLTTSHTIENFKIEKIIKMYNSDNNMIFIKKNALNKNVPNKNMYISKNHGIIINGSFIRARNLLHINGVEEHIRPCKDIIYNVLLVGGIYNIMYVNNVCCETLNPADPMVAEYI